jgi:hypothetical protein
MLGRALVFSLLFLFLTPACVEPYEFVIENKGSALVVEGLITDASYLETVKYPSDGRHFYVKLSYAHDVVNKRSEVVSGASVTLLSSSGREWHYTEQQAGTYLLLDKEFKALREEKYKLSILLANEDTFESDWQALPEVEEQPIGDVSFDEISRDEYEMIAGEKLVRPVEGIILKVDLPANTSDRPVFYRWDYDATWMYVVPDPDYINKTCWATNKFYLYDFTLHKDYVGGYRQELFFVETHRNERFYTDFSLLIRQLIISEDYHQFLNEVQLQSEGNINDTPPYNLETNLQPVNNNNKVVGFFAIAREAATRWYFNRWDLSYFVEDHVKEIDCSPGGLGGPHCKDCLAYWNGTPTLEKPSWWIDMKDRR